MLLYMEEFNVATDMIPLLTRFEKYSYAGCEVYLSACLSLNARR